MKTIRYPFVLAMLFIMASSCDKDLSYEGGYIPTPPVVTPPIDTPPIDTPPVVDPELTELEKFRQVLASAKFQLKAFYSNTPIDYNEKDELVTPETDLWHFVSGYLKDDANSFDSTTAHVSIEQNEKKISGINDPVIIRNYTAGEDENGIYLEFLDNKYNPLMYRVHEFGDNYFILSFPGPQGATLFSRFESLP